MSLVLSLFPGIGLLDKAFELEGFCVVRGPDVLWGGDVREFHPTPGKFSGVIGGPPCQPHSELSNLQGTRAVDLVPEFVRVVRESGAAWCVMENVPALSMHPDIPDEWHRRVWCDWDCGGATKRKRAIWTFPFAIEPPASRAGFEQAEWSLLASQWKTRTGKSGKGGTKGMHQTMTVENAERLQGAVGIGQRILEHLPDGISDAGRRCLAIHGLGNGVPIPLGRAIARAVKFASPASTGGGE